MYGFARWIIVAPSAYVTVLVPALSSAAMHAAAVAAIKAALFHVIGMAVSSSTFIHAYAYHVFEITAAMEPKEMHAAFCYSALVVSSSVVWDLLHLRSILFDRELSSDWLSNKWRYCDLYRTLCESTELVLQKQGGIILYRPHGRFEQYRPREHHNQQV
jgi:hypothetical protein